MVCARETADVDQTSSASRVEDDHAAAPVPDVEALREQVRQLEVERLDFIAAQLRSLREVWVLNRMSDALGLRRTHQQIVTQTLREAVSIAEAQNAWFVVPRRDGRASAVWSHPEQSVDFAALPTEARDLYERWISERPESPLNLPTYDPASPEAMFTAAGLRTAEHLMGVMIVESRDIAAATSSERQRLLTSMLRQTAVACENNRLFESMSAMIVDVVVAMALAIESRDPYTGGHVMRVTAYSLLLGSRLGLGDSDAAQLRLGGLLHDIGKVAVPDAILRKPGKLDDAEFEVMKSHAAVGHQIISPIPQLAAVAPVVRSHHERYDGRGYPDKLAGQAIHPLARIAAIADTFDAMTSDRPYRKGMPFETARAEVKRCAGTQFDPAMAEVFVGLTDAELRQSVATLQAWRQGDHASSSRDLLCLLDLDRPRLE